MIDLLGGSRGGIGVDAAVPPVTAVKEPAKPAWYANETGSPNRRVALAAMLGHHSDARLQIEVDGATVRCAAASWAIHLPQVVFDESAQG